MCQLPRCRRSADFSLRCAWLLDAYGCDASGISSVTTSSSSSSSSSSKKKSHGAKLRNLILSGELVPKESAPRWEIYRNIRRKFFAIFPFVALDCKVE